jgi:hypothetical protein
MIPYEILLAGRDSCQTRLGSGKALTSQGIIWFQKRSRSSRAKIARHIAEILAHFVCPTIASARECTPDLCAQSKACLIIIADIVITLSRASVLLMAHAAGGSHKADGVHIK